MKIGGRDVRKIAGALFEPRHYFALAQMARRYPRFPEMLGRYLLARGDYPTRVVVRTPSGLVTPTVYTRHDVLTVNEIFCREDYPAGPGTRCVVDFGSNIGLSALYFLTRNDACRVHLFEPVPTNVERLKANLAGYEKRYRLAEAAVSTEAGEVEFGVEPSGRYGGIGVATAEKIRVAALDVNAVLEAVLEQEDVIDVLKIDTEGFEERLVRGIRPELLLRIRRIYAEMADAPIPLAEHGFSGRRYGPIVQLENRRLAAG